MTGYRDPRLTVVVAAIVAGLVAAPMATAVAAEPVRFEVLDKAQGTVVDRFGEPPEQSRVLVANTGPELHALYQDLGLGQAPPVDLARRLVVGVRSTLPYCKHEVVGVDRDGSTVTVRASAPPPQVGRESCPAATQEVNFALSLERADLPSGRGTVAYQQNGFPVASTEAHLGGTAAAQPAPETTTVLPGTGGAPTPLAAAAAVLALAGASLLVRRRGGTTPAGS